MAALPYMQLYVADYLADTAHLNASQHGAYLLLLMNYWQRGKALPNNDDRLAIIARMSPKEWAANRAVVVEFFEVSDTEWVHSRVDHDLLEVQRKSDTNKRNGKNGGRPRKAAAKPSENERKPNGFDSQSETKGNRTEQNRTEEDHPVSGEMVAQSVMFELAIAGRDLRGVLDDVCRIEIQHGAIPGELRDRLVDSFRDYTNPQTIAQLDYVCGAQKFFGEGRWKDRTTWPWRAGSNGSKGTGIDRQQRIDDETRDAYARLSSQMGAATASPNGVN